MIRIKNLTKDFGHHKGIFDLSFEIQDGEIFGYLGSHGAGKTTTIRLLLGFVTPTRGRCFINGKSSYAKRDEILRCTGYLPEYSRLPGNMTGLEFLRFMAEMKSIRNLELVFKLTERFECNLDMKIQNMAGENRKKLSIICAFMHDPDVLLLDEPLNHLGSLMQNRFVDLLLEEKKRGKTIFISSHLFDEIERTCDRVGMLQKGTLVNIDEVERIRTYREKSYRIIFETEQDAQRFIEEDFTIKDMTGRQVTINHTGKIFPLVKVLGDYPVVSLETQKKDLEELFSRYHGGGRHV